MELILKYLSRWFVFGNLRRPIIPFKINLLYWKPIQGDNVGDLLSVVIYKQMLKRGGVKSEFSLCTKRIVSIGSVLSFVGSGQTTVWGTGLMNEHCVEALLNPYKHVRLDIRAVRGPLTQKCLEKTGFYSPHIYGDPAILMPTFYNPSVEQIKNKIIIIPHHSKFSKYVDQYPNVLNTYTSDWQNFIREIKSSEKVISSSLHGIILAESYGIPCVWLYDIPDSPFKYEDYYQSTGRTKYPCAESINVAFEMEGEINPMLSFMQKRLIRSFPYDLFNSR